MASPPDETPDTGPRTGGGLSLRMSSRTPSWRERENNKRRERRRRAIAAKIFAGLRAHGNYTLPKHCDNNEVLKALCREAGWIVEADGTTYRRGCRPAVEPMDLVMSASPSPCSSSQHQSPCVSSFNPSPASSSFPSPSSSPYNKKSNNNTHLDGASLIPWLKNLSAQSPYMNGGIGGSISAPVTPPISSPTSRTYHQQLIKMGSGCHYATLPNSSSTPPSPGDQSSIPVSQWFSGIQQVLSGSQGPSPSPSQPTSPTFSLISANPFGIRALGPASTHYNAAPGASTSSQVNEFAFGGGAGESKGLVKAWAGEEIVVHEDIGSDDLELTLGGASSRTR